jgi:hypothetical protein
MPCIIRSRLPLISHVTPYNAASSVCDPIKDDRRRGAWIKYCLPVRQCPQLSYAPPTTVPPAPSPLGSNCCQMYHPLHARSEEVGWPRAPLDLRWSPGGRHTETTVPTTGSIVFFLPRDSIVIYPRLPTYWNVGHIGFHTFSSVLGATPSLIISLSPLFKSDVSACVSRQI